MRIGKLAESTGIKPETIRFYEREGLLPAPARAANNYRVYGAQHRRRLCFLARLRSLGFRLNEVRELLSLIDQGDYSCGDIKGIGERHLQGIRQRLQDLMRLEKAMNGLVRQCDGGDSADCTMLEVLFDDTAAEKIQ